MLSSTGIGTPVAAEYTASAFAAMGDISSTPEGAAEGPPETALTPTPTAAAGGGTTLIAAAAGELAKGATPREED